MSIGVFWLGLTLAFECGFGLLVHGKSSREHLVASTFRDGKIWRIVVVVTLSHHPWSRAVIATTPEGRRAACYPSPHRKPSTSRRQEWTWV